MAACCLGRPVSTSFPVDCPSSVVEAITVVSSVGLVVLFESLVVVVIVGGLAVPMHVP